MIDCHAMEDIFEFEPYQFFMPKNLLNGLSIGEHKLTSEHFGKMIGILRK